MPEGVGQRLSVEADEYVLALGLEDFKLVDFGAIGSTHDYFRNVHRLQTVSSFSIQAWFEDDPVPPGIDSMITGMPQPFGILCPITRVRATLPPDQLPLQHEIIATGPERGYEDIADEVIKAGFIQGLRDVGFRIPDDSTRMHVVLRRNRDPFHRYLLTRPGELQWRPPHQSPLENLCLAGAWVRNDFALPCVDSAAEGALKVAGLIAARAASQQQTKSRRFIGMPRSASLVLPPPYRFPHSTGSFFLLEANPECLAEALPPPNLKTVPGFGGRILFGLLRHENVHARCDPSGAQYSYNEILLAAFVREKGRRSIVWMGLYPLCGLAPDASPGMVQPIQLMQAHWSDNQQAERSPVTIVSATAAPARRPRGAVPMLGDLARLMVFYNPRHIAQPGAHHGSNIDHSQLTTVALADVEVHRVSVLHDLRLRVKSSVTDPVYLLMRADTGAAEIRAGWGVKVHLAFSIGAARLHQSDFATACASAAIGLRLLTSAAGKP